jgi:AcrR family transcriptional regulator
MVNSYTGIVPTPSRTTLDDIVGAAREILEIDGIAGLTMQAVAERVGVRAPSLYKRVSDRDGLVQLVSEATIADLGGRLRADTAAGIVELARVFRAFAQERPAGYQLIMTSGPRPSAEALAIAIEPVLRATAALAGPEHALDAARTMTAWANGFIGMELAGSFNLGGNVDAAWEYGLARLVEALGGPHP